MSASRFLIVVFALAIVAFADDALDAKDSDFEQIIASSPFALVKFYAPWCGHCKRLAPEWDKAATSLKGKAALVRLDCTVETATAKKYEIKSYPTIKVFRDGQVVGDYDGGRSADAIVKYVNGNIGPAVAPVTSLAELEAIKKEHALVVVAFVADEGTTAAVTHAAAAASLRTRYTFVRVVDSSLFDGPEGIVVYKNFDEPRVVFDGDVSSVAELTQFLSAVSVKTFDEIGPENYKSYLDRGIPIGWLFVKPSDSTFEQLKSSVASVAGGVKGKMSMVWVDADKYGGMAERLGIRKGVFPSFVIDSNGDHFVFSEDKDISAENIGEFSKAFLDGALSKTLRSEPAPEVHTKDGLTTVVGSTFDSLVKQSGKDVLIEFYAPWCGHCKKLQPTFEQVAKELKDVEGIRIAQIDASSNDYDNKLFQVSGFPTIYFVPANGAPQLYEGSRSVMGFLNFLKEGSSVQFEMPSEDKEL